MTLERVMKYWLLRDEWFLFIITWCRKRSSHIWFELGFHLTTVVSMLSTTTVDDDDNDDMIASTQRSTGGRRREIGDDTNIPTVWAQQKRERDERESYREREGRRNTAHIYVYKMKCAKWKMGVNIVTFTRYCQKAEENHVEWGLFFYGFAFSSSSVQQTRLYYIVTKRIRMVYVCIQNVHVMMWMKLLLSFLIPLLSTSFPLLAVYYLCNTFSIFVSFFFFLVWHSRAWCHVAINMCL